MHRCWRRVRRIWWIAELTGVFHVGGGQAISWFDYASMIFRIAGVHPEVKPTSEREFRTAARRPEILRSFERQDGTLRHPTFSAAQRPLCGCIWKRARVRLRTHND